MTIQEISDELGYSSRHKFEEIFKAKVGITPDHYRKLATRGIYVWPWCSVLFAPSETDEPGSNAAAGSLTSCGGLKDEQANHTSMLPRGSCTAAADGGVGASTRKSKTTSSRLALVARVHE